MHLQLQKCEYRDGDFSETGFPYQDRILCTLFEKKLGQLFQNKKLLWKNYGKY